jgi:hypothetical protein
VDKGAQTLPCRCTMSSIFVYNLFSSLSSMQNQTTSSVEMIMDQSHTGIWNTSRASAVELCVASNCGEQPCKPIKDRELKTYGVVFDCYLTPTRFSSASAPSENVLAFQLFIHYFSSQIFSSFSTLVSPCGDRAEPFPTHASAKQRESPHQPFPHSISNAKRKFYIKYDRLVAAR